jgi:hypothetical protein
VAGVGDTVVGVAKVGNGHIAARSFITSYATNHRSEAARALIELPTTPSSNLRTAKDHPKEKTMSDQENRKLQHTEEQKPGSEQKSGNQPN